MTIWSRTGRAAHRALTTGALAGALLLPVPAGALDCSNLAANANVVEVSEDGQTRKGSGIILTYDGYIITAAHLIVGGIQPPYPLVVSVKRDDDQDWQPAQLKRIDPVLDLALLKLGDFPNRPSLSALRLQSLGNEPIGEFCLAGYGIDKDAMGRSRPKPFFAFDVKHRGDERGYIVANEAAEDGYSGGAAFRGGELLGMIVRRTSPPATLIVPTEFIIDFVASEGIQLKGGKTFEPGLPASELSAKIESNRENVETNRKDIARILRSVEWRVELELDRPSGPRLLLKPQRSFPGQIVDGTFIADMIVHFDHPDFAAFVASHGPLTTDIGVKIEDSGALTIDDLTAKIDLIRAKYASAGIDLGNAPYNRIEINGWVQFGNFASEPIVRSFDVQ